MARTGDPERKPRAPRKKNKSVHCVLAEAMKNRLSSGPESELALAGAFGWPFDGQRGERSRSQFPLPLIVSLAPFIVHAMAFHPCRCTARYLLEMGVTSTFSLSSGFPCLGLASSLGAHSKLNAVACTRRAAVKMTSAETAATNFHTKPILWWGNSAPPVTSPRCRRDGESRSPELRTAEEPATARLRPQPVEGPENAESTSRPNSLQ